MVLSYRYLSVKETYIGELPEGDKLDDVSGHWLPAQGLEHAIVSIQHLHGLRTSQPTSECLYECMNL